MTPPAGLIFIGGYGRSGSTLLERLLAGAPGTVAVGELRHVWERGVGNNELCGCGMAFRECGFWSAVLDRAFETGQPPRGDVIELWRRVDRIRYVPAMLGAPSGSQFRADLTTYVALLRRVYAAIREVSGCPIVVDSSKEIASGVLAALAEPERMFYLHLVRDPRAVAYSWSRVRRRPEVTGSPSYMPRVGPVQASWQWMQRGLAGDLMRRWTPGLLMRYEDLANDPAGQVARLRVAARLAAWSGPGGDDGIAGPDPVIHSVAGNPMRFSDGKLRIQLDEAWRVEMRASARLTTTVLTLPGLIRYRYRLW